VVTDRDRTHARRLIRWDDALARYRTAEAALASVEGTEVEFTLSACLAGSRRDQLYDRALGRFNHALRRLLRTPAPGAAALAAKLDLAVRHLAWELTGGEACMAALLRDAKRLS
jgi:hypothetical protein